MKDTEHSEYCENKKGVYMVTLYTTGCPRCKVLEAKLDEAGITYGVVNDPQKIMEMGFTTAPIMTVDGTVYSFKEAINWIGANGNNN